MDEVHSCGGGIGAGWRVAMEISVPLAAPSNAKPSLATEQSMTPETLHHSARV
jgi:hypothetical protein